MTLADQHPAEHGLAVHSDAILIDGTCRGEHWREAFSSWVSGGASACVVSVAAWESCRETMDRLARSSGWCEKGGELYGGRDVAVCRKQ